MFRGGISRQAGRQAHVMDITAAAATAASAGKQQQQKVCRNKQNSFALIKKHSSFINYRDEHGNIYSYYYCFLVCLRDSVSVSVSD